MNAMSECDNNNTLENRAISGFSLKGLPFIHKKNIPNSNEIAWCVGETHLLDRSNKMGV